MHRVFPLYRWMTSMPPSWCATMTLGGARCFAPIWPSGECPRPPRRSGAGGAPFPRHAALIAPARARDGVGVLGTLGTSRRANRRAAPGSHLGNSRALRRSVVSKVRQPERGVFALPPRVRQRVDHHALPKVPARHLAVVVPVRRLRREPVVVLRRQTVREAVQIPVKVLRLVFPPRRPGGSVEGVVVEVPAPVHADALPLPATPSHVAGVGQIVPRDPASAPVPQHHVLVRQLLVEGILVVRIQVAEFDSAADDDASPVALEHGGVADEHGHLRDARVPRKLGLE